MAISSASLVSVTSAHGDDDAFRTDIGVVEAHPGFPHGEVDSGTTGRADVEFDFDDDVGSVEVDVNDENIVRKAHLHCGKVGFDGPIIVGVADPAGLGFDFSFDFSSVDLDDVGCGTTLAALAAAMEAGDVYINRLGVTASGAIKLTTSPPTPDLRGAGQEEASEPRD